MDVTDQDDSQTLLDSRSNCLKLIFKSKFFFIPQNFRNLSDVDRSIYDELIKTNRYVVKSNVNEKVFKSFLDHWVLGLIPNLNIDNIQEYELLSQEFDRMKNLIQIFKRFNPKFEISYLIENNQNYKNQIREKMNFIQTKKHKFLQVINSRCENNFSWKSKNKGYRKDFSYYLMEYTHFDKELKPSFLLEDKYFQIHEMSKKEVVKVDCCNFSIDKNEKTADLLDGFQLHGEKVIPTSIKCENKDYFIKNILEKSFSANHKIISIGFEENSHLDKICRNAFSFSHIKRISFPPSLTIINAEAFYNCEYLESVTFPDNSQIKYIGKKAFTHTIISSISISSVNDLFIDNEAFYDCRNLKNAEFKKLHSIGTNVFDESPIESIIVPSDIVEFGSGWILGTSDLKEVKIHQNDIVNIQYYKDDFIIGKSDQLSSDFDVLLYARKDIEIVEIPSFIKRIASSAFNQCENIEKVVFEAGSQLLSIGDYAFYKSSLKRIVIPASVTDIEKCAFSSCENLRKVIFEDDSKLQSIGKKAFSRTVIYSMSIPSTVSVIEESPFHSSELRSLDLSKNTKLRVIENQFLSFSNVERVIFPSSVVAFKNDWCDLTKKLNQVEFDDNPNFTTINDGTFVVSKTDFMSNNYDNLIFASRNIENVSIPSFIKRIGHYAFDECVNMRTLEFPRNSELTTIEKCGFHNAGVVSVTLPSSLIHLKSSSFFDSKLRKVDFYDPKNSKLKSIGPYSFANTSLRSITIPPNLEVIGDTSLGFNGLRIVKFPKDSKVKVLNKNAFAHTPLQRIYLPASLVKIKRGAFTFCKMIEQVQFDDNSQLEVIGRDAFSFSSLKSIIIPHRISVIGERAFGSCKDILLIEISDHSFLTTVHRDAFSSYNTNLSIFIPKGSVLEKKRKKW